MPIAQFFLIVSIFFLNFVLFVSEKYYLFKLEYLLIVFLWLSLPLVLFFVCEKVSYLGLYHKVRSNSGNNGELFLTKLYKVCTCNVYLSLPVMLAIYAIMVTSIKNPTYVNFNYVILLGTLVIILLARVAVNPGIFVVKGINSRYNDISLEKLAHKQKDLMQSFFHSFVCASILVLIIVMTHDILNEENVILSAHHNTTSISLVKSFFLFYGSLLFITLLGEVSILNINGLRPIIKCDYKCHDPTIENTCEFCSEIKSWCGKICEKLKK